jgi:hypothetical protein
MTTHEEQGRDKIGPEDEATLERNYDDTQEAFYRRKAAEYKDTVSRPGKFEGEAPYVPYFWDMGLDGFDDGVDYLPGFPVYQFNVTDADRRIFPELLEDIKEVHLRERDDGFVVIYEELEFQPTTKEEK